MEHSKGEFFRLKSYLHHHPLSLPNHKEWKNPYSDLPFRVLSVLSTYIDLFLQHPLPAPRARFLVSSCFLLYPSLVQPLWSSLSFPYPSNPRRYQTGSPFLVR